MVVLRNVMSKVLAEVGRRRQQNGKWRKDKAQESMSELQTSLHDIGVIRELKAQREAEAKTKAKPEAKEKKAGSEETETRGF